VRERVVQAGLRGARVAGVFAPYSKVAQSEGVVIAVRYKDDVRNISKTYTEYDVKDLRTGQIYQNIRRSDQMQGMEDGDENVLRPAQKLIGAMSPVFDPKINQLSTSDGDRVLVQFSYGAQHTAVIVGVAPHAQMDYGTTREQGFRRFTRHKGTSVEMKKDGTYQIKRGDTTITVNADDTVEVLHKSGSVMRFRDNGDIELTAHRNLVTDGIAIKHGASAVQSVIKSTDFGANVLNPIAAAATALQTALSAALTAMSAPPGPPTTLPATITAICGALAAEAIALQSAIGAYEATLSLKVTTE
jgi:hypothetical protein